MALVELFKTGDCFEDLVLVEFDKFDSLIFPFVYQLCPTNGVFIMW
jgi:hypothetical protein